MPRPEGETWIPVYIDMMGARARTIPRLVKSIRSRLHRELLPDLHKFLWEDADAADPVEACALLEETCENLFEERHCILLLLDEWESVQARVELNDLIETLRAIGQRSHIAMVTATAHTLVDLYSTACNFMEKSGRQASMTSPFHNIFETVYLGLMPEEEWMKLVDELFRRTETPIPPKHMSVIGKLAGGHPYFTQLAGSLVWEAIRQGDSLESVQSAFIEKAQSIFVTLWHNETVSGQQNVIRQIVGLPTVREADFQLSQPSIQQLEKRGLLTPKGEVFSTAFVDFVRDVDVTVQ